MSSPWVALEGAEGMLPHPPEVRPVEWPKRHPQFKHSPPCCDPGRKRHAQGGRERGVLFRGEQVGKSATAAARHSEHEDAPRC